MGIEALAFDTETTGLDLRHGDKVFAWATCDPAEQMAVRRIDGIPFSGPGYLPPATAKRELHALYAGSQARPLVMHNAKFDLTAVEEFLGGLPAGTRFHDTHKMSHILQNHHQTHTLDHIAWELAGYERVDAKVKRAAAECGGFHKVPNHIMEKYQRLDVERTMCIFLFFWPKIVANKNWLDCYQTEIDLIPTTMRMERRGLMLHVPRTKQMITEMEAGADEAREEVFRIIGRRFNPESDPQLRRILYEELNFPVLKRTKKSKEAALDKHVLIELQKQTKHPIFDPLLKSRAFAKGVTVLNGYITLAGKEEVIHPTINTCAAITGRQSSENPNLQNVQKTDKNINPYPVRARHAFRPRPGYINIHVDYAGIEMRLLVHYSQEEEMIRCMREGDGDVHSLGAEAFFGDRYRLAEGAERKALRYTGKTGGFALAYGASPTKLALTLGVSPHEGLAAYMRYRARFPKIVGLAKTIIGWVREQGYVDSVFGRRIHVPQGEAYVGTNYLIQGTAGEVLKRAEIRVDRYNKQATGDEVKLLLPIHDEIIIEYPRARLSDLGDYLRTIRKIMIDFPQFSVPLDVEADLATVSWEQKTPYKIPK